eukprot:8004895-Pyramimonas_sp.AAC.1
MHRCGSSAWQWAVACVRYSAPEANKQHDAVESWHAVVDTNACPSVELCGLECKSVGRPTNTTHKNRLSTPSPELDSYAYQITYQAHPVKRREVDCMVNGFASGWGPAIAITPLCAQHVARRTQIASGGPSQVTHCALGLIQQVAHRLQPANRLETSSV